MRIVVTGGAGFLGSNLCAALLAQGHRVICVDNLISARAKTIAPLRKHKHFTYIRADISAPLVIPGKVDRIYNLACPASPVWYQKYPIETIRASTVGVYNMLELAAKKKARFLQTSTSEVYGDPLVHPQSEEYWGNVNPIGPRSCYDEGKRVAESLTISFRAERKVDTRIVRIFNTYGPNMAPDDGRVVSNFIVSAIQGKPLELYGDGSQTRSFCFVADLIAGIITVMESDETRPVNLGNPVEISMRTLAEEIVALTGSKSRIVHKPLPTDDPKQRCPIIARAQTLGWSPRTDRRVGLQQTIAYFRSIL